MKDNIELVIEPRKHFSINFGELWKYRELFYFFTWRDIKVKYKQTVLGILWVVLQPLLMMLVFTAVFEKGLGVRTEGIDYKIFAFSGLLLWTLFTSSINSASNSMVTHAPIIKKIYFPRLIIPCAGILLSLVDFLVALVIFVILLIVKAPEVKLGLLLLCWPVSILLTILTTLGLGSWLAALSVKYRDFRFIVPFMIQFGFFVTPVAFPIALVNNPWMQYLLALNPMYGAITLFRAPLMQTAPDWFLLQISFASAVLVTIVGLYYFRKTESSFADIV